MSTNTEYTGTNGTVGTGVTYHGHVIDTTAVPRRTPDTAAIQAEVAKMIAIQWPTGITRSTWTSPVATRGIAPGTATGLLMGFLSSWFFFKLDGDAGCDPGDPGTTHGRGSRHWPMSVVTS